MTLAAPVVSPAAEPASEVVPFNDLSHQWVAIKDKALPEVHRLFETGAFCLGPFVESFERSAAEYLKVEHALGVNSGTSALHLALIAAGVQRGDKVLVPAMTFIATAWAVLYIGAIPVFCDIDIKTATMDLADAERHLDGSVKAVVPVHLYGQAADMHTITEFAQRHKLTVIEDAAQAMGSWYRGQAAGTIGQLGCFSFYPGKNLGAAGEGGLIVTRDADLAKRIRALRNHGQSERYVHAELGFNYRMEGLQGIVLNHKLALLDRWTAMRRRLAQAYQERLADLPLDLPVDIEGSHVYHLYVVRTKERNQLRAHLQEDKIETGLHYPVPLHRQPCLDQFVDGFQRYPVTEVYAKEGLSLPLYIGMTDKQLDRVCDSVRRFFKRA